MAEVAAPAVTATGVDRLAGGRTCGSIRPAPRLAGNRHTATIGADRNVATGSIGGAVICVPRPAVDDVRCC
jgi:hypothetical protein